jgi:hypothetical protein
MTSYQINLLTSCHWAFKSQCDGAVVNDMIVHAINIITFYLKSFNQAQTSGKSCHGMCHYYPRVSALFIDINFW